jgi:hypothetical protein
MIKTSKTNKWSWNYSRNKPKEDDGKYESLTNDDKVENFYLDLGDGRETIQNVQKT